MLQRRRGLSNVYARMAASFPPCCMKGYGGSRSCAPSDATLTCGFRTCISIGAWIECWLFLGGVNEVLGIDSDACRLLPARRACSQESKSKEKDEASESCRGRSGF